MHEQESLSSQGASLGHRELEEIAALFGFERVPHRWPRIPGQVSKSGLAGNGDPLSHTVIVVASNRVCGMGHRPPDARRWIRSIVDEIAQAKTDIKWLVDRPEGGPVCMDVGYDQDRHFRMSLADAR